MTSHLKTTIPFIIFAVVAFAYLALTAQDLFFVVQSQDVFIYDGEYFKLLAESPGFGAAYAGSFLTQFAYHPLPGIALYVLLLMVLSWLVKWAFRIPAHLTFLAFVPALLLMMFVLGWDYGVFSTRHFGNLFSPVVGLIGSMLLIGLLNLLKKIWVRCVCALVAFVLFYPLLGVYAFLAGVISVAYPMVMEGEGKALLRRLCFAIVLFLFVMVMAIEVRWLFPRFNAHFTLMAGLPYLDYYRTQEIWTPIYITGAYLFILPVVLYLLSKVSPRAATIISGIPALAAVIMVPIHRFNDSNFRTLVAVEHAYEMDDTDDVLELCCEQERPIRSIIMYRNVELYRRGELLDRMFQYTWDSDTIHSRNQRMNTYISGPRVYQMYTFWNFSYRRAMERFVKYNPSYYDIKIMATDAICNREYTLADKYLSLLEHTLYYKEWAQYQRYLLDDAVLKENPVYKLHKQIVVVPEGALDNTEYCEYMLLKHFTNLYINTEQRAVLSIAAALVLGDEDVFWKLCLATYKAHSDVVLPRHVQEAALLFAFKRQNPKLYEQIQMMVGKDGAVCQQFLRNEGLFARLLSQPTEADMSTLEALCPGTYWYYYFCDAHKMVVYD